MSLPTTEDIFQNKAELGFIFFLKYTHLLASFFHWKSVRNEESFLNLDKWLKSPIVTQY